MKMKVAATVLALIFCCGCTPRTSPDRFENSASRVRINKGVSKTYKRQNPESSLIPYETPPETAKEFEADNISSSQRAKLISKAVTDLEGIEKASVIITGKTAIVGIETVGELDDAKLTAYKKEVEETVKLTDKYIKMVAVTAAGELVQRITGMADSVTEEEKGTEDNPDFQDIIFQIAPTI